MSGSEIRERVREGYAGIARQGGACCGPAAACCGGAGAAAQNSRRVGYSEAEIAALPPGADLGLGCGNPVALAAIQPGETVVDLGAGAGIDCFLAAGRVGPSGRVIGVDMTPEMVERARSNLRQSGADNLEFRLGEIEHLPVADAVADLVISNCVINLSPDKKQVFREACRVLKPGGRLMVSDIVLLQPLPAPIRNSVEAYIGCVAGAILKGDYLEALREAGFTAVRVVEESSFPVEYLAQDPALSEIVRAAGLGDDDLRAAAAAVVSVKVAAVKPQ